MSILNNVWVVGIGGGILSGLFVAFISRYLFAKKDNREYTQKVFAVNREIIYALRPGISEGKFPTDEVLDSLLSATARRYKVSREDVFQPKQIAEELIKEIMDSSFISSDTKQDYCDSLLHLILPSINTTNIDELYSDLKLEEDDYRRRSNARMSAILGLTSTIMVTMLTLYTGRTTKSELYSPVSEVILKILLPTISILAATVIIISIVSIYYSKRYLNSKKVKNEWI
ncbi:hypothetical protein [uncultured Psychrobacter sp.]|uniref:hypothetical protein n=1 Tax=uncultured Psychrobacter sp. TaxID=259303 RepID=UPI002614F3AB|nr:hypothetical protein [uncultured Psychrobacter sp.]